MLKKILIPLLILLICVSAASAGELYTPDDFTFTGGTGRVTITCPEIRVSGEEILATVVFSSPHYEYVKVGDETYPTVCDDSTSTAVIPAPVNRSFDILACTTAMSTPHEISYTLYIRVNALADQVVPGLEWESDLPLQYAEGFTVSRFRGGYSLIDVRDGGKYLVVPREMTVPEGLDPSVTVLDQKPENIYLAATSAMSLFDALDALDLIRFFSLRQESWFVPHAADAMAAGKILFAGKYDTPDYEMLVKEDCGMAIESTMISHAPKVMELLEMLGIPVFVDRSSYESHPLGRTEWIKLYGVLTGREKEAEAYFAEQVEALQEYQDTGLSVAFFYINVHGEAVVRSPADYIPRMIALAGGNYAMADMKAVEQGHASVSVSMEDFYAMAGDADFLIYNADISEPVRSVDELIALNDLLAGFKAVKEGNVWCAGKELYQATDHVGAFITDVHRMLTGESGEMVFLTPVQ